MAASHTLATSKIAILLFPTKYDYFNNLMKSFLCRFPIGQGNAALAALLIWVDRPSLEKHSIRMKYFCALPLIYGYENLTGQKTLIINLIPG